MFSRTNLFTGTGFLIVIVMMAVMIAVAINGVRSIQQELDGVIEKNAAKIEQIEIMRLANRERIIGLQLMLLLDDPFEIDDIAMRHMSYANQFIVARKALYDSADSKAEVEALDRIRQASMVAAPINEEIRELVLDELPEEGKALMIEKLVPVQDAIYQEFKVLTTLFDKHVELSNEMARKDFERLYMRLVILLILVVALCVFIGYTVTRRINKSEQSLIDHLDELEQVVAARTRELKQESDLLTVTLASIGDGVVTINPDSTVRYMNPAAEEMTLLNNDDIVGKPVSSVLHQVDMDTGQQEPLISLDSPQDDDPPAAGAEKQFKRANGETIDIEQSVADITDENGITHGAVVVLRDVSATRAMERKLAHEATHDPLTGLVNRREFESRVKMAINRASVDNTLHTICYIDLDRFKAVNDSCGHATGDRLLCDLSRIVKEQLRKGDTFARIGGDEFGLLLEQCSVKKGVEIAEAVRQSITNYQLLHDGQVFSVGASMGAVEISENTTDIESLLSVADAACYVAKGGGGGSVQIYRSNDDNVLQLRDETRWAREISQALDNNRFELHCQPIVGVSDACRNSMHYEILMRMRDSQGNLVYPGSFLPAAERYKQLTAIDRHVVYETLKWVGDNAHECQSCRFAINIAGASISDMGFLAFVSESFRTTGADPSFIIFEIVEHVAVGNLNAAIRFMSTLKKLGCEFSLDDFGRGFSSLGSLKDLPVDYLKIDGGFVAGILETPEDEATVRAINEIGQVLGKKTVAEFVENDAIKCRVTELGIDYVQGFGISRPFPLEQLLEQQSRVALTSRLN